MPLPFDTPVTPALKTALGDPGLSPALRQLLQAIEDGDPSAIETLIESYGSAEALWEEARLYSGQSGEGLLHLAAYQGNIDVCIILVTQLGLDIKAKDDSGASVLHFAIAGGRASLPFVLGLIQLGVDPSVRDEEGSTLLHHAVQAGTLILCRYLIDTWHVPATGPESRSADGLSPLDLACGDGKLTVARLLMEDFGADPSELGPPGYAALHYAALAGRTEVVRHLVCVRGVPVDLLATDGATALVLAARAGHLGIVQALLSLGASREATDGSGDTAAHAAICQGRLDVLRYLLGEGGLSVDARNKSGATLLCYAARCRQLDAAQVVLSFGPRVHSKDDTAHWTALHYSAVQGDEAMVRLLLQHKALGQPGPNRRGDPVDANAIDLEGARPIHYAAMRGFLEIFRLLVEGGAYYSVTDRNGSSALHWASSAGHLSIVRFLVEKAMDVNQQDKTRRTPLFYAAKGGHVDVIQYLLSQGAERSLQLRDQDGLSVLDAARDAHPEVVRAIKAYVQQEAGVPSATPTAAALGEGAGAGRVPGGKQGSFKTSLAAFKPRSSRDEGDRVLVGGANRDGGGGGGGEGGRANKQGSFKAAKVPSLAAFQEAPQQELHSE